MPSNPESILDSVKKVLGFDSDYEAFDIDITMYINSVFGSLQQLGAGPSAGFMITDNSTLWSQYSSQLSYIGMIKMYILMSARLAFDPPGTSFGIDAIKTQIEELAWRINIAVETIDPPSDPFGHTNPVFVGGVMQTYFAPKVVVLQFASLVDIDASLGNMYYLELSSDCTVNAPVNGTDGQHITLELTSNGHSVIWGNGWNFGTIGTPQLTSGGKADIISALYKQTSAVWHAGYSPGF